MKTTLLLFAVPVLAFAQTAPQRQKIIATYDQKEQIRVKAEAKQYMDEQKRLVAEYKKNHKVIESDHHSLQRVHNGIPYFFTVSNEGSSKTIRANSMYPGGVLGLDVTGQDMVAGVWDGGKVRNTHQEFTNDRVFLNDGATDLNPHSTHVTGTIIAAGVSPTRKGIAYQATAYTYDWDDDYDEMLAFGSGGGLVSNHSYGYDTSNLPSWEFGSYDSSSIEVDNVANANPYYQICIAAGNDRSNFDLSQVSEKGGYDMLSGTGTSKNGITVAAVNQLLNYTDPLDVIMSDFSNFGPTDDGRIKPDISAKGVGTSSCVSMSNTAYDTYSGTSMATPAITGLIVLLQQHYSNVNGGNFMRASTVRGLICHTAREAGDYDGPDYSFGWGLADGLEAANVITNNGTSTILEEHTLTSGQTYTKQVAIGTGQKFAATICWTDPTGTANATGSVDSRVPRLKNNLDLKILKDGQTYYPWKLDPDNPMDAATREADNNVDNIEKVQIDFAEPGVYTIQVKHKGASLVGGSQVFSLIASGEEGLTLAAPQSELESGIVLYPNPVRNTLNIAVPNDGQVQSASVYDLLGKQVASGAPMGNSVDTSALAGGVYFVHFNYNGKELVRKFIKE